MSSVTIHVLSWVAALGLGLVAARAVAATRGSRAATTLVVLRMILVVLVAALYHKVFHGRVPVREKENPDNTAGRTVLMLEDRSSSMGLACCDGRTRAELAAGVWSDLAKMHRKRAGDNVDLGHALFARNVTDDDAAGDLVADASNLTAAVASCLGREVSGSIVVVSDGASTDGPVPRYLVDWMGNYGLGVYAVCAGTPSAMVDAALGDPTCAPVDPEFVSARLAASGFEPGDEAVVSLAFDGKTHAKMNLPLNATAAPRWDVPELAPGWHTYAIAAETPRTEATVTNNTVRGTFRVTRAEAVLFVTGSLRPGDFQLARILRGLWRERVCVARPDSQRVQTIDPKGILLLVLSNVEPRQLPDALTKAVLAGEVSCVQIASPALSAWCRPDGSRVPLEFCGVCVRTSGGRHGSAVRKGGGAAKAGLGRLVAGPLTVDFIYESQAHDWGEVILDVQDGDTSRPLLVADSLESPRNVVFLTDLAWKWALSPDGSVRGAYYTLWSGLIDRLIGTYVPEDQLTVSFTPEENDPDRIAVTVRSATGLSPEDLAEVELRVEHGPKHTTVGVAPGGDGHTLIYEREDGPAVAWFTATAVTGGKTVHSARTPVVFDGVDREFLDLKPQPDLLAQMVAAPDRFAPFETRGAVLRAAVDNAATCEAIEPRVRRQRSVAGEALLALACLLVAGLEWRTERRAHNRPASSRRRRRRGARRRAASIEGTAESE